MLNDDTPFIPVTPPTEPLPPHRTFREAFFCKHEYTRIATCKRSCDGYSAGCNIYYMCKKCGKVRKVRIR